jgi:cell wall-associated NlpC family hydrolase
MKFSALIYKPLSVSLILAIAFILFSSEINAQERERVIEKNQPKQEKQIRPTTQLPVSPNSKSPTLTNEIVVTKKETPQSLIRKTSQSQIRRRPNVEKTGAVNTTTNSVVTRNAYSAVTRSMMLNSIKNKYGIRYRMGTQGPNAYDCSGFVWKVFYDSGIRFTRTSASQFWRTFEPVYGDDRFEFGTLVFFNRLGHVGIVADRNGFYHASSSKGVTYSKFEGYWEKRIVGFRRIPASDFSWEYQLNEEN